MFLFQDLQTLPTDKTPCKTLEYDCVLCLSVQASRSYKLSGDKCKKENVISQIMSFCRVKEKEIPEDGSICKVCLKKLTDSCDFQAQAVESMAIYNRKPTLTKRCHMESPADMATPSTSSMPAPLKKRHAKKSLQFDSETESLTKGITRIDGASNEGSMCEKGKSDLLTRGIARVDGACNEGSMVERGKSDLLTRGIARVDGACNEESMCEKGTSDLLASHCLSNTEVRSAKEDLKHEILSELSADIVSLTAKHGPRTSVLLKYQGLQELVKADDLLADMVKEMAERFAN